MAFGSMHPNMEYFGKIRHSVFSVRNGNFQENGRRRKPPPLILKIEVSPVLWDVHSAEYRNKTKQKAIEELAMEFGVDGAEIQRKLHILRSQFQQELKKR